MNRSTGSGCHSDELDAVEVRRDGFINNATTKNESNENSFLFNSLFVVYVAFISRRTLHLFFCRLSMICDSFRTFASVFCLSTVFSVGGALAGEDAGSELLQPAMNITGKESVPAKTSLLAVREFKFMVLL